MRKKPIKTRPSIRLNSEYARLSIKESLAMTSISSVANKVKLILNSILIFCNGNDILKDNHQNSNKGYLTRI